MSPYTITARIFQTNPGNGFFRVVEKTVWKFANGGTWDEINDAHVLNIGDSGTSGILRLKNEKTGEDVTVALGVHNYKRWGDVVTGLSGGLTATIIQAQYYEGSTPGRFAAREAQRSDYSVTSTQPTTRKWEVKYTVSEGEKLEANIIIY